MGEDTESRSNEVLDVSQVYLVMKKEYRISRNSRAKWYFQYLDKTIEYTPTTDLSGLAGELDLASVIPENPHDRLTVGQTYNCRMAPNTTVTFLARNYRMVFTLDLSPSAASVDINKGKVLIDEVFDTLKNCVIGLSRSFFIPGSDILFSPQVFVTVIAYTPLSDCQAFQVLSQGCLVSESSVQHFLSHLRTQLTKFENTVASSVKSQKRGSDMQQNTVIFDDIVDIDEELRDDQSMTSPELIFINMLKNSMLALGLLPENSTAAIVIITDGMIGVADAGVFESILTQMRTSSTACSFIRVGSGYHPNASLGHVPNVELLQFFATATFGAYLPNTPRVSDNCRELNMYHKAFFTWNFQKGLESPHIDNIQLPYSHFDEDFTWMPKDISSLLTERQIWASPVLKKKHLEENIHASIASVMSVRLREGYTIKYVAIAKGGNQIEVKLVLPWRHDVNIEYIAVSAWPLSSTLLQTHIQVFSEGSYEFLHDVTCPRKQPFKSPYRCAVVKRFWLALQGLSQTDKFLQHLESFSSNPMFYTIPESIRSGVPLFYMPPNSTSPVLSLQQSPRDTVLTQFASFWKRIVNLDPNVWQKWMHSHRIGLVLEHDKPPPKYLHIPNSSGRFSVIQCRQAMTSLNVLLKNFSTFVLLENHSYIKMFFSEPDKPPTSFYLMRVASKPPCVVLRVAFLGGTPGHERNKIVTQLQELLRNLKFPQRNTQNRSKRRAAIVEAQPGTWKSPLQRDWSEINCCILLTKPVEKILLRYERLPRRFLYVDEPSQEEKSISNVSRTKPLSTVFNTLSRYLYHHRWVWSFHDGTIGQRSMPALGKILSTIAKLRLQEGFHFADTSSGITNMLLEVQMGCNADACSESEGAESEGGLDPDDYHCVVQYVLFPPQTSTTKESVSEDDIEEDSAEADGELQIITECWVEPQSGIIVKGSPERQHFDGLNYKELAKAFYPKDYECISTMLIFEHLCLMCHELTVPVPVPEQETPDNSLPATPRNTPTIDQMIAAKKKAQKENCGPGIQYIPYSFDIMKLLPKSQQVEMLFSTFIEEPGEQANTKSSNKLLFDLLSENLRSIHDRELTLSSKETVSFMDMLHTRGSNEHSEQPTFHLPFRFPGSVVSSRQISEETVRQISVETTGSPATNPHQAPNWSQSNSPSIFAQPDDLALSMTSTNLSYLRHAMSGLHPGTRGPRWKCFIKSLSHADVILTVMPSSYADLKLMSEDNRLGHDTSIQKHASEDNEANKSGSGKTSHKSPGEGDKEATDELDCDKSKPCEGESQSTEAETSTDTPSIDQTQNSKDNVSKSASESGRGCLTLPVYVYHCSLSRLTDSLVYTLTYQPPEDVFQDYTFDSGTSVFIEAQSEERTSSSDEGRQETHERRRSIFERSHSVDQLADNEGMKEHCNLVSDTFLKCFVRGVYKSLQLDTPVHYLDVEAAINNICEESHPIEISASKFLCTVCRHLQKTIEKHRLEELVEEEGKSDEEEDDGIIFSELDAKTLFMKEEEEAKKKNTITFPLSTLLKSKDCGSADSLMVKRKFSELLGQFFKPVPSNPMFYFYCPPAFMQSQSFYTETEDPVTHEPSSTGQEGDESEMFVSDYEELKPASCHDKDSIHSNFAATESLGSSIEDLPSELDSEDSEDLPLFIHLACTLRTKSFNIHSKAVTSLPTCIGELANILDEPEIDLNDLAVTLDMICLTLPLDAEVNNTKPTFERMMSFDTEDNDSPMFTDRIDREDAFSGVTSMEGGFLGGDPLNNVPEFQQNAVWTCKEQIEWLLTDERASALRNTAPITSDILDFVATHVKDVKKTETSIYEQLPLHFVYGPDQSMAKFTEEFEHMNVPGYCINRDGDHYFLVTDRARNRTLQHALAINSKLQMLSREQSPAKMQEMSGDEGDVFADQSFTQIEEDVEDGNQVHPKENSDSVKINVVKPTPEPDDEGEEEDKSSGSSIQVLDDTGTPEKFITKGHGTEIHQSVSEVLQAASQSLAECQKGMKRVKSETAVSSHHKSGDSEEGNAESADVKLVSAMKSSIVTGKESVRDMSSLSGRRVKIKKSASTENIPSTSQSSSSGLKSILRHKRYASTPQTPVTSTSLQDTPVTPRSRHSSGPNALLSFSGSRSRNTSGPPDSAERKLSSVFSSSRGSCTGEVSGYDGDSSDASDSENTSSHGAMAASFSIKRPLLPDFWLIMKVCENVVEVYFHTREDHSDSDRLLELKELYKKVLTNIKNTCQLVNQYLLLQELNDTRMCNSLLVPQADEDIWQQEELDKAMNRRRNSNVSGMSGFTSDSEEETTAYLEATLHFEPGFFACDLVWKENFMLHPRLKTGPGRTGVSRGITALRTVLNTFSVNNRKNMFVIQQTTGEVFYLRLNDYSGMISHGAPTVSALNEASSQMRLLEEDLSPACSLNASSWSLHTRDETSETPRLGESTDSSVSRVRGLSRHSSVASARRNEDSIELTVHGITPVGPEIREDLIQALQKRLDDAVLDMITVTLSRNPMCKLTPEDVQFIQKPLDMPKEVVHFTIPSNPSLSLCAVNYYLRQNLLQTLFTPKYTDSRDDCHFQDFTQSNPTPFAENEVFLFNRPHASGGKGIGIAIVHVTVVDCWGKPVEFTSSTKPVRDAYKDEYNTDVFEELITTQQVAAPGGEQTDGHAFIRFSIWERGDIDRPSLIQRHLLPAIRHTLCDIVMEYRLLTAPLCGVPPEIVTECMHGASAHPGLNADEREAALRKLKSDSGKPPLTRKSSSPFPLNLFGRIKNPTSPTVREGKSFFGDSFSHSETDLDPHADPVDESRAKLLQCEAGERGTLLPMYSTTLVDWFDFCLKQGVPSVFKMTTGLLKHHSLDLVLKEFKSTVNSLCCDLSTPTFLKNSAGEFTATTNSSRDPLMSEDKSESTLDTGHTSCSLLPGQSASYLVIGRNIDQWQSSVDIRGETSDGDKKEPPCLVNPATRKNFQRFIPLEPTSSQDVNSESAPIKQVCVPRQRFLILTVEDRELTLYVYNWAQDLTNSLERQLKRLMQWHNARGHLLCNIASQKMGLFNHHFFERMPSEPFNKERNPFNQSTNELEYLIRSAKPSVKDLQETRSRVGSITGRMALPTGGVAIQKLYKDCKPLRLMCKASYGTSKDLVCRHGTQLLEIRVHQWKENEKKKKLLYLHDMWQQRVGPPNMPISEDMMHLLKHLSRLIHNVATPLMFSPVWRKKVLDSPECNTTTDQPSAVESKPRSRHSSGASIKSKKSDDTRQRGLSADVRPYLEAVWHADLRTSFVHQYIQFLQALGFVQIQVRPQSPKRSSRFMKTRVSPDKDAKNTNPMLRSPLLFNLQKTVPGGIMVVELTFLDVYFDVKMYAFDMSGISQYGSRERPHFTEECDKFKDLTHVHSFAHDFHLRSVQGYLAGQQLILKKGYHLTHFLADFIKFHPYAPSFSRNHLFEGTLTFKDMNTVSHQLFDYMLQRDKSYGMKVVRMIQHNDHSDVDQLDNNDYALVCQSSHKGVESGEGIGIQDDYDIGLVITHDTSCPVDVRDKLLRIKYYLIFTSRRELFPKLNMEQKFRVKRVTTPVRKQYSASPHGLESRLDMFYLNQRHPVVQHMGMTFETSDFHGYSGVHSQHFSPAMDAFMKEARNAKDRIVKMVDNAKTQCRRDGLWQRMLLGDGADDEKKKRRSDTEDSRDGLFLTKLAFKEFKELLGVVKRVPLSDIDNNLMPFMNMSISWYKELVRVLLNKYGDTRRHFVSADNREEFVAVLNPNYLDTFILLGVDTSNMKAELSAVYRESVPHEEHTPTNPNLPTYAMQNHVQGFVNACAYQLWCSIIQ